MNDTLKAAGRIGAELGAAKAESERLRKALKRIIDRCEAFVDDEAEMRTPSVEVLMGIAEDAIYTVHEADAALSKQAEPTDTFTAVDMATAAAQGFRDGQAAVEQATAQGECNPTPDDYLAARSALESCDWSNVPLGTKKILGHVVDLLWLAAQARPAQTEQQPPYPHEAMDVIATSRYQVAASGSGPLSRYYVRAGDGEQELYRGSKSDCEHVARKLAGAFLDGGFAAFELYAAPIAQTAPLRYTNDGALAECPCCGSLDVGGAHDTVHCYRCGLTLTKPGPLQNAMDAWNMRIGKQTEQPEQSGLASAVRAYLDAIDNGSDEYDVRRARSGVRHALSAQWTAEQ